MKHQVWIAFGSNQQAPVAQLVQARKQLAQAMTEEAVSSLYRTPPWGGVAQPDFVNAVGRYATELEPLEVLQLLMEIEQAQGRVRKVKNGPRTLDLDILLYDEEVIDMPSLQVPHPRMHQRDFVLYPLAEIDAERLIPQHGQVKHCLAYLAAPSLPTIDDPRWQKN